MKRPPFKIADSNYDLLTFEMHVAEYHPEFKKLKSDNQPSYMNPNFHEKSLDIDDLPGSDNPYSIFAMNLFSLDDVEDYYWECQSLLERPVQQLVKDKAGDFRVRFAMQVVLNGFCFIHPSDHRTTTISEELTELVSHCCFAWDEWLGKVVETKLKDQEPVLTQECLKAIADTCSYVADQLVVLSKLDAMNQSELSELRVNQKFAFLASSLLQMYQENIEAHVLEYIEDYQEHVLKRVMTLKIDTKRYVDLVLFYELSKRSDELEREHTGINYSRDVELKSPNAFIYTKRHGGFKAEDIRVTYRWLFINAWLHSWLKSNDVSANKAAEVIANDDRFFYLKDDSKKLTEDGDIPTVEQLHARRQKRLNTEFSKWKKHNGPFGYISERLFKKSSSGYAKEIEREKKRKDQS